MGLLVLDKKVTMFDRDEEGKLLPREVPLVVDEDDKDQIKFKGESVVIIPLMRGELKKMFADALKEDDEKDVDGEIIRNNCVNPSYKGDDIKFIRGPFANAIVNTILFESGLDVKKPRKKALEDKEDEFSKN